MSYLRVIPRDLFNEASLLKCLGRFWIETERFQPAPVSIEHDGAPFEFEQSNDDGSLSVANIEVKLAGQPCRLWRPLNSRETWPLYLESANGLSDVEVFDKAGNLSSELLALIERVR